MRGIVLSRKKVSSAILISTSFLILAMYLMIPAQDLRIQPKIIIVPDEFETLSEAISHADSGDIIYVRNGVYEESTIIDKPVVLIGESAERVVIDGGKSSYT
ncbi:MAG: hypothetical protein N3F65_05675, partial [Nitrososphaeria archaeon]|nr:hypothetical protein [Nitrososphaeria archaeon]